MTGTDCSYHGLTISDCRTVQFSRKAVVEEGVYVYSEIDLVVEGCLNPALNNFQLAPTPTGNAPEVDMGHSPASSDHAIRFWMLQPRHSLVYTINGEVALQSPAPGASEDAARGPYPVAFDVLVVHSDQTMEVRFHVKTWVNEAGLITNRPPFLKKNTWTVTHHLDSQYFLVRVVEGSALFDVSLMPQNSVPDDFRPWILPPGVPGMKREEINCIATEDGTGLRYRVVDRESRYSYTRLAQGITDIECRVNVGYANRSYWDNGIEWTLWGAETLTGFAGTVAGAGAGAGGFGSTGFSEAQLGALGMQSPGWAGRTVSTIRNLRPNRHIHVQVRVTGNNDTAINVLSNAAYIVLASRLPAFLPSTTYSMQLEEMRDYKRGIVEVQATFASSIASAIVNFNGRNFAGSLRDLWVNSENFGDGGNQIAVRADQAPVAGSQVPQNAQGTRGHYLAVAAAQALQDATHPPEAPAAPRNAINVPNPNN